MKAVVTAGARRQFLGSALALGAGAAIGGTLSLPRTGVALAAGGQAGAGQDRLETELLRQLREAVHGLRRGPSGESAPSVASVARLFAASLQTKSADADFARRIQAEVRRDGSDAFLRREPDVAMLSAELKA